ncbi:hypothetical protein D8674_005822 [Pyrus ussuriensis x Pyrus communis]|uniref:Uncharacterized protein n=1 Tax=Pyrus ussuriensis x Pyrus communis TaxID=2448454 RepID=A0A5N5FSK3_9ROSA|nr:hypothetical protein D8674_005822 [Pyrus ussuriensis x Pyrus communis]
MAVESPKCLTAVDVSFTTEDCLQRGKSPPPLGSQNKAFKEEETFLDSLPSDSLGHVVSLASLFLGLLYHELNYSAPLKSFLYASFLQIFLCKCIKGLKITLYLSGAAKSRYVVDSSTYLPEKFPLACHFLELLDDVNNFIFHPYLSVPEGFTFVMFFTNVVRCQLDFDQGVPISFPSEVEASLNNLFWSSESNVLGDSSRIARRVRHDAMKHFRPRMMTPAKEATSTSPARRAKSARASASSSTPKPLEFLDITEASEEEWSNGETKSDEAAEESLATKESNNTTAKSNPKSRDHPQASLKKETEGEDSGRELSGKDSTRFKRVGLGLVPSFKILIPGPPHLVVFENGPSLVSPNLGPPWPMPITKLLCWQDMISDVVAIGVSIGSLVERLGELCDTMFGLRLEKKEKGVLDQFIKVNKLKRALEL